MAENNLISKMRNLEELSNLEEVYLSSNCLSRIQGLDGLRFLRVLDLGKVFVISRMEQDLEY